MLVKENLTRSEFRCT